MSEPVEVAKARERAEAAELEALVAEGDLSIWQEEHASQKPYLGPDAMTLAQLTVRAHLLRHLSIEAFYAYRERASWAGRPENEQREVRTVEERKLTAAEFEG